jgi:hypothetical protein
VDLRHAYRDWFGKRLAYLLPCQAAAVLALVWLLRRASGALPILAPCLTIAAVLGAIIGYLLVETIRAELARGGAGLQEARALRRHLRSCESFTVVSLLLLAALLGVPGLLREDKPLENKWSSEGVTYLARRPSLPPVNVPTDLPPLAPSELASAVAAREPERPAAAPLALAPFAPALFAPAPFAPAPFAPAPFAPAPLAPAPLPPAPAAPRAEGEPAVQAELARGPSLPRYSARDFELPLEVKIPYVPRQAAPAEAARGQDQEPAPFRPDPDDFRPRWPDDRFAWGLIVRPMPDERDPEGWPDPELRLQGFLLLGGDKDRIPGIEIALDLPFGKNDSIEAIWMAARLPAPEGRDVRNAPNWDHVTLAYVRRLTGYTSHAPFDLAVGIGVTTDFFGPVQGIPDAGTGPKFAPYVGLDASFWQYEVVGLLLHVGESIPATVAGSSMGATDFRAEIRWDLSRRVSVRGGYRVLLLKYKPDELVAGPPESPLTAKLSGPAISLDVRF